MKDQVTITEFVPSSRIVFEAAGATGQFRHCLDMQEEGSGTRLTKAIEPLQLKGVFKLFSPLLNAVVAPRALAGDLKRIKASLEAGAA